MKEHAGGDYDTGAVIIKNNRRADNITRGNKNLMRGAGLEPARPKPYAPQTYVSAYSTTRADNIILYHNIPRVASNNMRNSMTSLLFDFSSIICYLTLRRN